MGYWTLVYDPTGANVEKSLADWDIKGMAIEAESQAMDTCTFTQFGVAMDDAQTFAFKKTCVVYSGRQLNTDGTYSGGKIRFQGLVLSAPRVGSGDSEYISYKLGGPWWYFDNQTMELPYQVFTGGTAPNFTYETLYSAHFILNLNSNKVRITTGEVVEECVDFAIAAGAPVALLPDVQVPVIYMPGVNDGFVPISAGIGTALYAPLDEVNTITVAECIRKMFRWTPDIVSWFDYTTDPPTFHCQRAAGLTPVALPLFQGSGQDEVFVEGNIIRRDDLLRPYVTFIWEAISSIDGQEKLNLVVQSYPTPLPTGPSAFGGLTMTLPLSGMNINETSAQMATTPIPNLNGGGSDALAFLAANAQWHNDATVASVKINSVTVPGPQGSAPVSYNPSFPYAVTSGSVCPWMKTSAGSPVGAARDVALFNVDVAYTNGEVHRGQVVRVDIPCCNINTNGKVQVFTSVSGTPEGELIPGDLAQQYYNAVNVPQWQGEIVVRQTEADCGVWVGNTVTVPNSVELADMVATVQSVRIEVDTGETTIRFGPNKLLTPGDAVNLLRVTRFRVILFPTDARFTGDMGGGSDLQLANQFGTGNTAGGAGYKAAIAATDNPAGTGANASLTAVPPPAGPNAGKTGLRIDKAGDQIIMLNYEDVKSVMDGYGLGLGAVQIRFRVWDVCPDQNGVAQQAIFASSPPFPKPT